MKLDENLMKEFNQRLIDIYKFNHNNIDPSGLFATYGASAYLEAFSHFMLEKELEQHNPVNIRKSIELQAPPDIIFQGLSEAQWFKLRELSNRHLSDSDLIKKTQEARVKHGVPENGIDYNGEPRK